MALIDEAQRLARFRADPRRVRVSIRRLPNGWIAFVGARGGGVQRWGFSDVDPRRAVMEALETAEGEVPGIDLDMQWAYEHPWR